MTESDPLQRAILRLSRAGCRTPQEIARYLDINLELSETLLRLFYQNNLIKGDGSLTTEGERLLTEDDRLTFDDGSHEQGWMLRDSLSGDMIPYLTLRPLKRMKPEDVVSTATLPVISTPDSKPDALQLKAALDLYRRLVNSSRELPETGGELLPPEENEHDSKKLFGSFAKVIWNRPLNLRLPVYFYVYPDDPKEWQVITGFREAALDHWFTDKLHHAAKNSSRLKSDMDEWLREAADLYPSQPTLSDAEMRISSELPMLERSEHLSDVRLHLARALRGEDLFRDDEENLDIVLVRYQKALEALLDACINKIPNRPEVADKVNTDDFKSQAEELSSRLGVNLPPKFVKGRNVGNSVKSIGRYDGTALRDRALFLFICAAYFPESLSAEAFTRQPELLNYIHIVTNYRNKLGAHHSDFEASKSNFELQEEVSDSAFTAIRVLSECFFDN
jgi:hypothetical protein